MEIREWFWWMIAGTSLVTWIPRVLPLLALSKLQLPDLGTRWLRHIPVAVMAALLAQELLLSEGRFNLTDNALELLAALPAICVAVWTRSLFGTVIAGIVSFALWRLVL
ncbi:AzlD domain-containing protein [Paenibacillus lutrae]|uniref:AzlD domain-containing protein n=1 Tax=Paenibacillus lutrae TaxID=2078573 RepID=A0A7X3FK26_9BACL|nr:AzlD domain-containing protein [Paenibacillus lutrae]MVP01095.1 AzlD domain-containing protein [Paenibacillus lutrae]